MRRTVYLDYTQEELDRAYDQRAWVRNADEVIGRYGSASRAVQSRYAYETHRYGAHDDELLDWYPPVAKPAGGAPAPIHVFIHGGAWRSLTKDDSAFPAPTFVENGAIYVAVNFSVMPKVRMPDMVAQCRRAIVWIARHAAALGGDPARIHLSGHSSGGHLAAVLLTTDWRRFGLTGSPFKSGICASGMYDLRPVMLSARSSYVKLSAAEEEELSPARHVDFVRCPLVVAYGDGESPEFKRQAKSFAATLEARVRFKTALVESPGLNHYEVVLTLGDPDGALGSIALDLMFGGRG